MLHRFGEITSELTQRFGGTVVESTGDGHLINLSSLFGLVSVPGQSAYNATKYAVRGFTEALREEMLVAGHRVGVLAVDPSSPFSGGAILGDRVRMQDHAIDPGVFTDVSQATGIATAKGRALGTELRRAMTSEAAADASTQSETQAAIRCFIDRLSRP